MMSRKLLLGVMLLMGVSQFCLMLAVMIPPSIYSGDHGGVSFRVGIFNSENDNGWKGKTLDLVSDCVKKVFVAQQAFSVLVMLLLPPRHILFIVTEVAQVFAARRTILRAVQAVLDILLILFYSLLIHKFINPLMDDDSDCRWGGDPSYSYGFYLSFIPTGMAICSFLLFLFVVFCTSTAPRDALESATAPMNREA